MATLDERLREIRERAITKDTMSAEDLRILAYRQYAQARTGAEIVDALVELARVGELGQLRRDP